jgi:signal transduction protein with GAF and PtsI domain
MFSNLQTQMDSLDKRKEYLDADWGSNGNHALLDFYVQIMPKVTDSERCSIFIHDPLRKSAWLKAGSGLDEREIEISLEKDSIVGKVMQSGEAVIVSDMASVGGEHIHIDEKTGFRTRNVLCAPIKSLDGSEITGAVQLLNKKDGGSFDSDDKRLLEEMLHYLEWSLENIYFHLEATDTVKRVFSVMSRLLTGSLVALMAAGLILSLFWSGVF